MMVGMFIGYAFVFLGVGMLVEGWREVYHAARARHLATGGLYGIVRHPQYTGIFLALFGEGVVHWPTVLSLAIFPLIVWLYVGLARREEAAMVRRFGAEYLAYRQRVPMFFPRRGQWRRLVTVVETTSTRSSVNSVVRHGKDAEDVRRDHCQRWTSRTGHWPPVLLLVNIAVWSLLLNGVWEFAQCVLFYDMRSARFWPGVAFMLLAVAGDVLIVLALCWLTVIVWGNTFSYRGLSRGTITMWLLLLSVSLAAAVALEYGAVHLGLWRYSERMPTARIGGEQVGWAPVLQMTLLPALSLWMAAYLPVFRRRRSK